MVVLEQRQRAGDLDAELVTADGRRVPVGGFRLQPTGSWGGVITVDLRDVVAVRLLGEQRGDVLEARFQDASGG